jgi:hypothetical protein
MVCSAHLEIGKLQRTRPGEEVGWAFSDRTIYFGIRRVLEMRIKVGTARMQKSSSGRKHGSSKQTGVAFVSLVIHCINPTISSP